MKPLPKGAGTLETVVRAISDLSGAEVDGSTKLTHCGLDSFGASSLVGLLRARIPGLRLQAKHVYNIETVQELVGLIDEMVGTSDDQAPKQDAMERGEAFR